MVKENAVQLQSIDFHLNLVSISCEEFVVNERLKHFCDFSPCLTSTRITGKFNIMTNSSLKNEG